MLAELERCSLFERRFLIRHSLAEGMHLRTVSAESSQGTILYVHGLGESALSFEALLTDPKLASWKHLAPDLPGYGKSFWESEPLPLEEQARRLARLLSGQVEEPVVVLGHSMGGVIGTLLAELEPEKVRAFVNVEGNLSLADCGYSSQAARYSRQAWLEEGAEIVLGNILADEGEASEVTRAYAASIQLCDPRAFHLNSDELVEFSSGHGLAARMADLSMPGIFLHGVPRGTGERSLGLLARHGVRVRGIEGAGHWPFLDQPAAFVDELLEFLESLPPSPDR